MVEGHFEYDNGLYTEDQTAPSWWDAEEEDFEKFVTDNMVTKTDFEPVKKVVYGMMVLTLTAVMVAILSLVVTKA